MVASGGRALALRRTQILAYRRAAQGLDERLPARPASLRQAAWAGLQDSMPRSALLSLHARVAGTAPSGWEDPSLVQMWGPRFSAYVVPRQDVPIFSLGRFPAGPAAIRGAEEMADRLDAFLVGRRMSASDIGRRLGVHPNALRYAAPTGRVLIRWDGARQPTVWTIPAPEMDVADARLELARRYLHLFGPATAGGFATWAGIKPQMGQAAFESLGDAVLPVRTPIGDGWILATDETDLRAPSTRASATRLLPSGDTYFLLQGAERELLVPDARRRSLLWTPRVWPGAVLVAGEIVGVWRRGGAVVSVQPWRRLTRAERGSVEAEAATMPLPGMRGSIAVEWAA